MNMAVDTEIAHGTLPARAMELLGSGVPQESVASALGVSPSYVSQLLSDKAFAGEVTKLKYEALTKHTERDGTYDSLEDKLLAKLEKSLPLILRPAEMLKALQVVNGAKRRGTSTTNSIVPQSNLVEITMPIQIVQQFTTNLNNQVIKAGDQDLITIQSSDLAKKSQMVLPTEKDIQQELYEEANPESLETTPLIERSPLLDLL